MTDPTPPGSRCGYTYVDQFDIEQPCDRPATGWRWYQGHGHEDALDVACELHSNEGGRRLHAAEAEVERLDSIITGVATGDGHSCQIGLAKIVQCDDRGVTDAEARAERAESNARGKQAVIEARRATLDRVRALADGWLGSVGVLNALFETLCDHATLTEPDGPNGAYIWCACGWRSDEYPGAEPGLSAAIHVSNALHAAITPAIQESLRSRVGAILAAPQSEADVIERGRRLASKRDDLIASGVDPATLAVPLAPQPEAGGDDE